MNAGEFMDRTQLAEEMKETHGLRLKGSVLNGELSAAFIPFLV